MKGELKEKIKKRILTGGHRVRFSNEEKTKGIFWLTHHVRGVRFRVVKFLKWRFVVLGKEEFMS